MLRSIWTPTTSQRKLRLVGCAGYRLIWHLLIHEELRNAVDVAERFADEAPAEGAFKLAWENAWGADSIDQIAFEYAKEDIRPADLVHPDAGTAVTSAVHCPRINPIQMCAILADVFGPLPFGKVTFNDTWRDPSLIRLAQDMYERRDFSRMEEVGTALKELGCRGRRILNHCLQPGHHVRGCWVVDLVLGKD